MEKLFLTIIAVVIFILVFLKEKGIKWASIYAVLLAVINYGYQYFINHVANCDSEFFVFGHDLGRVTNIGNIIYELIEQHPIFKICFILIAWFITTILYKGVYFIEKNRRKKYFEYLENNMRLNLNNTTKQSFEYFIPTRWQKEDPSNYEEISDGGTPDSQKLIPYFMHRDFGENKYFMVLGDSGMGKTTFLYNLGFYCYKKKKKFKIITLGLSEDPIAEIDKTDSENNTILLLDGLDEYKEAIQDNDAFLKKIIKHTRSFLAIVITCRTQFFPSQKEEPEKFKTFTVNTDGRLIIFEKVYISPLNYMEIKTYLKNKFKFKRNEQKRAKMIITNCPKLMVRPMLLSYIDDLMKNQDNEYKLVYEIYQELVYQWMEKEIIENEVLEEFSCKVADYMYDTGTIYATRFAVASLCKKNDIKIGKHEASSRSLLNRTVDGNLKFAHKSILEYFLAKRALSDLEFRREITSKSFAGYDMVKLFLEEMDKEYLRKCNHDNHRKLEDISFYYMQLSKEYLWNMEITNCKFEGCNLSGTDFDNSKITNTNFQGANLSEARFVNTVLFKINLSKANLSKTNLSGSDLSEVYLTGAKLLGTILSGANLRGAIIENAIIKDVKWQNAIFDENQILYLEKKYNMRTTKVYIEGTKELIDYDDFCEKRENGRV